MYFLTVPVVTRGALLISLDVKVDPLSTHNDGSYNNESAIKQRKVIRVYWHEFLVLICHSYNEHDPSFASQPLDM